MAAEGKELGGVTKIGIEQGGQLSKKGGRKFFGTLRVQNAKKQNDVRGEKRGG